MEVKFNSRNGANYFHAGIIAWRELTKQIDGSDITTCSCAGRGVATPEAVRVMLNRFDTICRLFIAAGFTEAGDR